MNVSDGIEANGPIHDAARPAGRLSAGEPEHLLAERLEPLEQIVESLDEVFWLTAPDKEEVYYVSPAYARIWERSRERLRRDPKDWLDAVHPDDRDRLQREVRLQVEGAWSAEYRIVRPGGEVRWVLGRSVPIRDREGRVIRIAGISRDITDQKNSQESLEVSRSLLRALSEASPDGILAVSLDRKILHFNRRFREIWGLPEHVLAAGDDHRRVEAILDLIERPDEFLAEIEDAYRHPERRSCHEIRLKDARIIERVGAPVAVRGELIARVWYFRDITVRRRSEETLQKTKEEAERANRAKSEFLSRMSHELRTPLNAILGFAQLLELDLTEPGEREAVEHIQKAGGHLLSLIDEVLDLSKIEAGRFTLSLEPVEVNGVIASCVGMVRALSQRSSVSVRFDPTPDDTYVRADEQRLTQVLLNFLSNAIKYNRPAGAVHVQVNPAGDDRLRIAIRDTGFGIDPQGQDLLFLPFERLGAEARPIEGTGLGLTLSKGLVEAMGGAIGVESVPGEGSTFWVDLPLIAAPVVPFDDDDGDADETVVPADKTRMVLYIEDNLANLRLVGHVLARRPEVRLLAAMQGSLGLDLAHEHRPELILLDVHLPDLSGDEVLKRIRDDPDLAATPVVAISADATPRQIQRMKDAGARDYLTKPIQVQRLLEIVDEVLDLPQRS